MPKLDRIVIEGFKSIKKLDLKLGDLNVLIGANGAGKTNFISFFHLLNRMVEGRLQAYVASNPDRFLHHGRKRTPNLGAQLLFGNNAYAFSLAATDDNTFVFNDETLYFYYHDHNKRKTYDNTHPLGSGHRESLVKESAGKSGYTGNIAKHVVPALESWRVYHFHDTSDNALVKQQRSLNDNLFLQPDASNLAAFLYRLRETAPADYLNIRDTVRLVAPFFDDFQLRPNPFRPDEIQLEWQEVGSDTPFRAAQMSDGTLRFICLATLLLQPAPPTTILIDEPELGLHPYAIGVLASLLRSISKSRQIIVSTQSVPLLNQMDPGDVIVVDHKDGASQFSTLDAAQLADWLDDYSLGDLWEKNVIGGRPCL